MSRDTGTNARGSAGHSRATERTQRCQASAHSQVGDQQRISAGEQHCQAGGQEGSLGQLIQDRRLGVVTVIQEETCKPGGRLGEAGAGRREEGL